MEKESILTYNLFRGFGEIFWITCPACWNSMKLIHWEDGTREEYCPACGAKEREMGKH
jgi:Zn ribbon nucleic-acid-binding protein